MAEIVNLRLARKAKKRSDQSVEAQANRARHGATKAERQLQRDEADRLARTIEGAKREES